MVFDFPDQCPSGGVVADACQTIAVVPVEFSVVASRDQRSLGDIAFAVVQVTVSAVRSDFIVELTRCAGDRCQRLPRRSARYTS